MNAKELIEESKKAMLNFTPHTNIRDLDISIPIEHDALLFHCLLKAITSGFLLAGDLKKEGTISDVLEWKTLAALVLVANRTFLRELK